MQNKLIVKDLIELLKGVDENYEIRITSDTGVDQCAEGMVVVENIFVNDCMKTLDIYANVRIEDEDGFDCDYE